MAQSKKQSGMEIGWNAAIGFVVAAIAYEYLITPLVGSGWISYEDTIVITIIMTISSMIRSYLIRRYNTRKRPQ